MPVKDRPRNLWSRLVWPVLWPLLLVQLVLVLLVVLVQCMAWFAPPRPNAWLESTGLLLLMLTGTGLTALAFLYQLRYRLSDYEREGKSRLADTRQQLGEVERQLPAWLAEKVADDPPGATALERLQGLHDHLVELKTRVAQIPRADRLLLPSRRPFLLLYQGRIVSANTAMQQLLGQKLETLVGTEPAQWNFNMAVGHGPTVEMQIMDGQQRWHALRVERLEVEPYQLLLCEPSDTHLYSELLASRERAREDSRLKSRYLALLQRELEPLLAELDQNMQNADPGEAMQSWPRLREQLADLQILATSLADTPGTRQRRAAQLRVLVVDDGPVSRMLTSQILQEQGIQVDCVESGAEALERQRQHLRRKPYDLVLMDIFMPGMDGVETSRRWRAHEARTYGIGRTTLVALTANATEHDRQRFVRAGMDDYLAKPYGPRQLLELVRRWHPASSENRILT